MKILSHRGYWKHPSEKNSTTALARSFNLGFGTETDLRDLAGQLVVSHDPAPAGANSVDDLLELHKSIDPTLTLALNIKADGLQTLVRDALERAETPSAFVFDMSIPDAIQWLAAGVPVFTRQSDVEPEPLLLEESAGVWLDGFRSDWWSVETVMKHIDAGKQVCIVSPELHRREYRAVWDLLNCEAVSGCADIMLCTDYPEDARELFGHGH